MEKFINTIDRFSENIGHALAWLLLPIIGIVLYTAVMRYFFHTAVPWGFEMGLFAFGIHGIGGGGYCLRQDGHVNVDVLAPHLPKKWSAVLGIFSSLVIVAVTVGILYLGSRWAWRSTLLLERSIHGTEFNPQIWWFKWIIPLSALLVLLQNAADLCKKILVIRRGR